MGDAPTCIDSFYGVSLNASAYVYSDASGFPAEGELWHGMIIKYRPEVASLSIGSTATLVSGSAANIPVTLSGTNLDGGQLVFLIVNAGGTAVYTSGAFDAADSFNTKLLLDKAALSLPAGDYTFRASVIGVNVSSGVPLTIAPNTKDYWTMSVLKGSLNGGDALEIRFADVGFERLFLGEVFVNDVKYDIAITGNSIYVPGTPMSGVLTVKVSGVKYPSLFPSYSFTFTETVTL